MIISTCKTCINVLLIRVLPIFIVLIAIFIGWLNTKMIPEGTMFATIIPLFKGQLPATIFGPYAKPLTPIVPADLKALSRPINEMFLNLPGEDGGKIPAQGLGMCCRASAYDEETVRRTVLWYLLLGGRHIDTADLYLNHQGVGKGIQDAMKRGIPRSEIFVTTKIPARFFGFKTSQNSVKRYLEELNLEYIDLLLLHFPKQMLPILSVKECTDLKLSNKQCRIETWKGLSMARENGFVRNIGVSNFNIKQLKQISNLDLAPIAANQFQYNPWVPDWQQETFDYCQKNNIPVTAYSSLGAMMQSAKAFTVDTLKDIAKTHDKSVAQILLRWALQMNAIIIPGTGNPKHMEENLSVYGFELSKDEMELINSLKNDPKAKEFFYMKLPDEEEED